MRSTSKRQYLFFLAAWALYNIGSNMVHPVLPTFIQQRGFADGMFGYSHAAMCLGAFLFAPFWGKMCGRISSRNAFMIGLAGYLLGQFWFFRSYTGASVIAARFFSGATAGSASVAALSYTINVSSDGARDRNIAVNLTVSTVCASIGYFAGGLAGTVSVATAFYLQFALIAVDFVLFRFACVSDLPAGFKPPRRVSFREVSPFTAFGESRRFMTGALGLLFLVTVLCGIGANSKDLSFNYQLRGQFGFSSAYNGIIRALAALTALAANAFVCLPLVKKGLMRRSLAPFTAITLLFYLLLLLFSDTAPALIMFYLAGVFADTVRSTLLPAVIARDGRGGDSNLLMGFNTAMLDLGAIFGALLAGILYGFSPKLPYALALVLYIPAALLLVLYNLKSEAK